MHMTAACPPCSAVGKSGLFIISRSQICCGLKMSTIIIPFQYKHQFFFFKNELFKCKDILISKMFYKTGFCSIWTDGLYDFLFYTQRFDIICVLWIQYAQKIWDSPILTATLRMTCPVTWPKSSILICFGCAQCGHLSCPRTSQIGFT